MKVSLRSTSHNIINIPAKFWKELGWKIGDEIELIECSDHGTDGYFSHKTITVERVKDQTIKDQFEEIA
tara:strand:- start:28 stop:234 length:207 start_codon:yes stop_codon:yes gene_type:complete